MLCVFKIRYDLVIGCIHDEKIQYGFNLKVYVILRWAIGTLI